MEQVQPGSEGFFLNNLVAPGVAGEIFRFHGQQGRHVLFYRSGARRLVGRPPDVKKISYYLYSIFLSRVPQGFYLNFFGKQLAPHQPIYQPVGSLDPKRVG
jgi:hypothetical protein